MQEMKKTTIKKNLKFNCLKLVLILCFYTAMISHVNAQVILEQEVKISDFGLHFNGSKIGGSDADNGSSNNYDFFFGRNISAHGDAVKTFGNYVFMTWYKGGKLDRHTMLSRYNTATGTIATIEFPHRHTGFQNRWWIGESHNTIAVGISPLDGTIHLLYDMHAYSPTKPSDGSLAQDYFRYSYSKKNVASLPDDEFTIDKFVQSSSGNYKHLRTPGNIDQREFIALTYPRFFLNDQGDLLFFMREGGNNNGMYKFTKYNANTGNWENFVDFNRLNAKSQPGIEHNWGLYGDIKYVNGKIRIGFQRRLANNNDKYMFQNGVYYAYSDDPSGATQWKNHTGEPFTVPLFDADKIKIMEPGDYVETTNKDRVRIVGGFDWTVTANGDVHIKSEVRDLDNNVTKNLHTYKPAEAEEFITTEQSIKGSFYTSGPNVYTVGLENGRVIVYKAEGGTDNFEKVYEATSGRKFDHGVVHIENGKAYYYLMENSSGSAQPLYLQIIDLGVVQEPFRVSITTPSNGQNYYVDKAVQISANAFDTNVGIAKVVFKINDTSFGEDTTKPYAISWTPSMEGEYTIQAVAYNNNNETVSSLEITVNAQIFDPIDINGKVYRLKNVATGKYLKSSGGSVEESDYVANDDSLYWKFVKTNIGEQEYYNIDSEVNGVLRGAGSGAGNTIISTGRPSPNSDVDKVWTSNYIETEDVYRFNVKDGNNFLYHQDDGNFYNIDADINDARSKWFLELANEAPLSIADEKIELYSVDIYPNPAKDKFTIALKGLGKAKVVINDMLGKVIYSNTTSNNSLEVKRNENFTTGIYIIKVIANGKSYHSKLVVK